MLRMKIKASKILFGGILFLIVGGAGLAVTGVLFIDPADPGHDLDTIHASLNLQAAEDAMGERREHLYVEETEATAERGFTVGELMRTAGIIAVIVALITLFCIEFLFKERIPQLNYRLLLLVSLIVLPGLIALSATSTVLETTKSVQSCASCHVMDPFVDDLLDPESTTLAARHYQNKWISEYQCYTCHTTYGAHGTFEGKRDGFRHWLLFVTRTWEEPISYAGSYPNINCTDCHAGSPSFDNVLSHQALATELATDQVSCTSCHGPSHPLPGERGEVADHRMQESANVHGTITQAETQDLIMMLEAMNE